MDKTIIQFIYYVISDSLYLPRLYLRAPRRVDPLWYDNGRYFVFYRIVTMDNGLMEKIKSKLDRFEEDIFEGKDIDIKEFYRLKKHLIDTKKDNQDLLELHMILEAMLDKSQNELMNKRLNLLTIWSTIFLPLSFYTGMWGMNFDDVPLLTGDHGFWIFVGLTVVTIVGMWIYFKKNRWIQMVDYPYTGVGTFLGIYSFV